MYCINFTINVTLYIGPPILVYRYTEYRDITVNVGGIDTGIGLSNTVVFGIGNSGSQQRHALHSNTEGVNELTRVGVGYKERR